MAKKSAASALVPEVLPAEDKPDVLARETALVASESTEIQGFFKGAQKFFAGARQLEEQSLVYLDRAKALKEPTTKDEDQALKDFARECKDLKSETESYWDKVVKAFHGIHKGLTGGRGRGMDNAQQAYDMANRLHNAYVRKEEERVRREAEERRRAEEAKAAEQRRQELAALETQRLAAEASMPSLSERESVFVSQVANGTNSEAAARMAGYADPLAQAGRLMKAEKILTAIKALTDAAALRRQAEAKAATPIHVDVIEERPEVDTKGDTGRWTGECFDPAALILAFKSGTPAGIPYDLFEVNQAKLNQYATALHERLDLWPGCRAKKTTRIV